MLSPSQCLARALGDGLSTGTGLSWQAAIQRTTAVLQASLPCGIYLHSSSDGQGEFFNRSCIRSHALKVC